MHFMAVASRASSTHVMYKRDLTNLLNLCMEIHETELALELGELGNGMANRTLQGLFSDNS